MYYGTSKEYEKIHNVICQLKLISKYLLIFILTKRLSFSTNLYSTDGNKSLKSNGNLKKNITAATNDKVQLKSYKNVENHFSNLIQHQLSHIHSEL